MVAAINNNNNNNNVTKEERTEEETSELKRAFFLNFNNYTTKSYKDAILDKLHNHMFQADGDYLVVNNRIANFIIKLAEASHHREGLPKDFDGHKVDLKVPKIPSKIYYQIVSFFKDICLTMNGAEAFVQVYYDTQNKKYVCHVPEQVVTQTTVRYNAEKNLDIINRERYIFVFEVHSHNTMDAFWSGTDNADEKETRFYGVLGKIDQENIAEKFRFIALGKYIDIDKNVIFDFEEEEKISKTKINNFLKQYKQNKINKQDIIELLTETQKTTYPKEWIKKIKQPERIYQTNKMPDYSNQYKKADDDYFMAELLMALDMEDYELQEKQVILEQLINSMTEMDVNMLLEILVESGFDGIIQSFKR